ncbi:MAG: DHH family phosphoesterase, partial [Candidatus Omnitrophota bacterium]
MQKIWNITKPDLERRAGLSRALGVSQVFAQLLINRGLATKAAAEGFLDKGVSCLHDPYLFSGMDKAVARIRQAVSRRERVLVFGDYDVDGVTSAALMKSTLEKLGLEVLRYLPQRVQQGYGINEPGIAYAREKGARLFISVDCGITNFSEIDAL